jgi:polyphenol oxidase
MSVSRRTFLRSSLAVGPFTMTTWLDVEGAQDPECTLPKPGTPVQFVPKEPKVVQRLTAADLNDPSRAAQLKIFRDAVGQLRKLPATDPRSWTKQIAQHCISCDPNNQQNIHFDWFFVGWHRALLYFVEKILRTLSKTDDLRLPY